MKLEFEWLDAPGVQDAAEAATWAELEIEVSGVKVSELLDERHRRVRTRFHASALPLAEWLLASWPRLVHERRVPLEGDDAWWDWRGFHHLRAGRRGGAMPNLQLIRFSDEELEVIADADRALAPGMSVRFLRDARARVPVSLALAELDRFLRAVAGQLSQVRSPRAEAFRAALVGRDARNGGVSVLGRLGVDQADSTKATAVLQDVLRDQLVPIIEASAAPTFDQRLQEARRVVALLPAAPSPDDRWRALEEQVRPPPRDSAWLTGWAAAGQFREAVGLGAALPLGNALEVLEERCGWKTQDRLRGAAELATGVDAVHVRARGAPPCVVTTFVTRPAQTFRLARSLYHGLFAGGVGVFADSSLLGSRFSEANAFAAELVAPVENLRDLAPDSGVWQRADLDRAARATGASVATIAHQVENRKGLGVLEAVE